MKTIKTSKTMKQNYFLKAAGVVVILMLMSNQVTAQSTAVSKLPAAVKVIDNKGTIKYFQSNNGITQIVNTAASGDVTTTTWQLGGILTDDTYIDVKGKAFGLKGLALNTTGIASVDGGAAGYTLLVSDASGKVERILATSLIQGGVADKLIGAITDKTAAITFSGITGLTTEANRISVFRNGIKLRATDWTFSGDTVTIAPTANLPLYEGDEINVQWVK